jgi:hypothetical protein
MHVTLHVRIPHTSLIDSHTSLMGLRVVCAGVRWCAPGPCGPDVLQVPLGVLGRASRFVSTRLLGDT